MLALQHGIALAPRSFEGIVVAFVVNQFLLEEMDDIAASHVQELSCVTHNHDRVFADICDVVLQPHHRIQIQVIRGLVQQ